MPQVTILPEKAKPLFRKEGWEEIEKEMGDLAAVTPWPLAEVLARVDTATACFMFKLATERSKLWTKYAQWCAGMISGFADNWYVEDQIKGLALHPESGTELSEMSKARLAYLEEGFSERSPDDRGESTRSTYLSGKGAATRVVSELSVLLQATDPEKVTDSAIAVIRLSALTAFLEYTSGGLGILREMRNKLKIILMAGEWV